MHPEIIYDYFGIQNSDMSWLWAPTRSRWCFAFSIDVQFSTGSSTKTQLHNLTFVIEVHFQKHTFHCLFPVIFYDSSLLVKQLSKCIPHLLQMYSMVKNNCASRASPAF